MSATVGPDRRPQPDRSTPPPPEPVSFSTIARLRREFDAERRAGVPLPPGPSTWSLKRSLSFQRDPLAHLLAAYAEYGPVFTVRVLSVPVVFMIGPAANHFMLVSDADRFSWRDGSLGDLIPLLGDGLLTTDGRYHRRARQVMVPSFHKERIALAGEVMLDEIETAVGRLREGENFDLYAWTRQLALRVAMRALLGFDPDGREAGAAEQFERALAYYSKNYFSQLLRGPGTPFSHLVSGRAALDELLSREISDKRRRLETGEEPGKDLLSLLIASTDGDGNGLSDGEVSDQAKTLLFAGHDTTTSTVAFLFYELARNPAALAPILAEQDAVLGGSEPTPRDLTGSALPELEMAIDETLRLYPPAWIGPRRALEPFEFDGMPVPGGLPVSYSSWASHRLPDVWPEPHAFRPERFSEAGRKLIPKGAYVPFGGGSRTCIGMRFGQMEVRAIATAILRRWRLEGEPGYRLSIRQMPTLSPRAGMPMRVARRETAPVAAD